MEADLNSIVKTVKEEVQKMDDLCQQKVKVGELS